MAQAPFGLLLLCVNCSGKNKFAYQEVCNTVFAIIHMYKPENSTRDEIRGLLFKFLNCEQY